MKPDPITLSLRKSLGFTDDGFEAPQAPDAVLPADVVSIAATSNDPAYLDGRLWNMHGDALAGGNIYGTGADEAWAAGFTGRSSVVVGVIDTGIDYTHRDLFLNVWLNQGEIPATLRASLVDLDADGLITIRDLNGAANAAYVSDLNANGFIDAGDLLRDGRWCDGVDADRDGYRDDLIGWDFVNNDNDPFDDNSHGTHVSGTIGATGGDGIGVAGINWSVQIVALKFLNASGSGATADAARAVDYFTAASTRAVAGENYVATNNSWGGGGFSTTLSDAVTRAAQHDILFVAAAGNSTQNNDTTANYPANLSTTAGAGYEAVVSVAALTSTGGLASFSNYGATTVDLAAPGASILSTTPNGGYSTYSGTSMAAPHVTGAIALYASANPTASAAQIRAALLASTAMTPALVGKTATGGRLDIGALMATTPPVVTPPAPVDSIRGDIGTTATLSAAGPQASYVDTAGDEDWFAVALTAGRYYTLALDAAAGSALDPLVRLLNASGTELMANDDAVGANARLAFTATASGTYFVSAGGWGTTTGGYVLSMTDAASAPTLSIAADSATKAEGQTGTTAFTFTVTRGGDTSGTTTVNWAVSGTTSAPATAADFAGGTLPTGSLTFLAGETARTLTVQVAADSDVELAEAFKVTLSAASGGARIVTGSASGTILNDDAQVSFRTTSVAKTEGNSGTTRFSFTLVRSGVLTQTSTLGWAVGGTGAAPANAADFVGNALPTGTVTFSAGQSSATINVDVQGDTTVEAEEAFALALTSASPGTSVAPGGGTATGIIGADEAQVSITALTPSRAEGNSGTATFEFALTRTGDTQSGVSVGWRVVPVGTSGASASDFVGDVLPRGTASIARGQTEARIKIAVSGDPAWEADERFAVVLDKPSGNTSLGVDRAEAVIVNDDAAPLASVSAAGALATGAVEAVSVSDSVTAIGRAMAALKKLDGLSSVTATGTTASETLNLNGLAVPARIDMGGNAASFRTGADAPRMSFIGKEDALTLGDGAATVQYALRAASGVLTLGGFTIGTDVLDVDLRGGSVLLSDTQYGNTSAAVIHGAGDAQHGIVVLGQTAAALAAAMRTAGGHALFG